MALGGIIMGFILGAMFAIACVVIYEEKTDLPFSWAIMDFLYDACGVLLDLWDTLLEIIG